MRAADERQELVAAEAREQHRRAGVRAQALGHRYQQRVPDRVPEAVIDALEVIEVHEHHGHGLGVQVRERCVQPVGEQGPVRKAGQRVVAGGVTQLRVVAAQAACELAYEYTRSEQRDHRQHPLREQLRGRAAQ